MPFHNAAKTRSNRSAAQVHDFAAFFCRFMPAIRHVVHYSPLMTVFAAAARRAEFLRDTPLR